MSATQNHSRPFKNFQNRQRDLASQLRGHGIANLSVLLGSRSGEEIAVIKRLKSCGLAHSEAAALNWVVVDIVVPVFRDVRDDCRGNR